MSRKIDVVVLDKTGTLTEGRPVVSSIVWSDNITDKQKNILYSIEAQSEHPLAKQRVWKPKILSKQLRELDSLQRRYKTIQNSE